MSAAAGDAGVAPGRDLRVWGLWAIPLAFALWLTLTYPTWPGYDSLYSLLWGREITEGVVPGFDAYRAPTQHPLLVALSVVLGPLGEAGGRLLVGICMVSVVALAGAAWRLGRLAAGTLCGVIAALLILSRMNYWLLASIGFLDLPYIALVGWAAVLEAERPRRGGIVWALLALAGLLRPEAWVLAGAYALWIGWPGGVRGVLRAAPAAAIAPVLWALTDLAVTGSPVFSLTHTDDLALALQRERPLTDLPGLGLRLLSEIVKPPVIAAAAIGAAAAIRMRRRELTVPAALALLTVATYALIAVGGLPNVYRYLLNAGTGIVVFAAFGLAGFALLDRETPLRRWWAVAATFVLVAGGAWTVAHTSPAKARVLMEQRAQIPRELHELLSTPEAQRLRACAPVTVPNQKLIPVLRLMFDLPEGTVVARTEPLRLNPRRGAVVLIDEDVDSIPALSLYDVPSDRGRRLTIPPPGFTEVGRTPMFILYGGGC